MAITPPDPNISFLHKISLNQAGNHLVPVQVKGVATASTSVSWERCGNGFGPFDITTAESMIVSSDSADDASGGTGVEEIVINYLDADRKANSVTVTMDGTTGVAAGVSCTRVNEIQASSVGSGGNAADQISVAGQSSGTLCAIKSGAIESEEGHFSVPDGYNLVISDCTVSNEYKDGETNFMYRVRATKTSTSNPSTEDRFATTPDITEFFTINYINGLPGETNTVSPQMPWIFPEKTDITLEGKAGTSTPGFRMTLSGYLSENDG